MEKVNATQKRAMKEFQDSTQASESQAYQVLKTNKWRVEQSINYWYDYDMQPEKPAVSKEALQLYQNYKSQEGDYIYENTAQFIQDIGADPTELLTFYIMKLLGSKEDFTLDQDGFTSGLAVLNCKTIQDLQKKVPQLRKDMISNFQSFYNWVGRYTCGAVKDTKRKFIPGVNKETEQPITEIIKVLFNEIKWAHTALFAEFLNKQIEQNANFQISLDSWDMTYQFIETGDDLSNYDEYAAWPALIDDFMEYYNQHK